MPNTTPPSTATGHDSPISNDTDDLYGRLEIAKELYEICESANDEYSTRIGLYGPWGSGKTSVLNFVRKIAEAQGNLVITFSASGVADVNALWVSFYAAFKEAAEKMHVTASLENQAKEAAKRNASKGEAIAGATGNAVNFFFPGFGKIVENAITAATGKAANIKIDDTFIKGLRDRVREDPRKRIIVFVDDLDRADPKVVPLMLLALRELLDLPGFCFVIAIDYDVVTRALGSYNEAWANRGGIFLEKIVDFAIALPLPTDRQIKALAMREFENCCSPNSYVSPLLISKLLPELPRNPRQLKLIARILGTYKKQVARHNKDELDIAFMVRMAALRVISSTLAERVYADIRLLSYADFRGDRNDVPEPEKEFDGNILARVQEWVQRVSDLEESRKVEAERILVGIVNAKLQESSAEKLFYTCRVLLGHSTFTQKEFESLVSRFQSSTSDFVIENFVDDWSKTYAKDVHVDLLKATLAKYLTATKAAENAYAVTDKHTNLQETALMLKLLEAGWQCFLKTPLEWAEKLSAFREIHKDFTNPETIPTSTLVSMYRTFIEIAKTDEHYSDLLDLILVFDSNMSFSAMSVGNQSTTLAQELFLEISPIIAKVAGRKLSAVGNFQGSMRIYMSLPWGWIFLFPNGPLLSDPGFSQIAITEALIQENVASRAEKAYGFLAALSNGFRSSEVDSPKALALNVPLSKYLWETLVQVQPHETAINSLYIFRKKLVDLGMNDNIVEWPQWLKPSETPQNPM
jgi:KAP family P-loop domain